MMVENRVGLSGWWSEESLLVSAVREKNKLPSVVLCNYRKKNGEREGVYKREREEERKREREEERKREGERGEKRQVTYECKPWTPPSTMADPVLFSNRSSPLYIMERRLVRLRAPTS